MRIISWVIVGATLLSAGIAAAQQAPCRATYRLGETVPLACRDTQKTRLPPYLRWGEGYGAAHAAPLAPAPRPEWRYFGGYHSAYGFGR